MDNFDVDLFPGRTLSVALYKPGYDISSQKDMILSQGIAVINAALIFDILLVQAAAAKCLIAERDGAMKTKNLNAELLYNLSPSLHVTESLKTFGLSPGLQTVLFVAFDVDSKVFREKLKTIMGDEEPLSMTELTRLANLDAVKKTYKIKNEPDMLHECLCTISTKGI